MRLKQKNIIQTGLIILTILLLNLIFSSIFLRIDLTSDSRYTMNKVSKSTMQNLNDIVYVRVYLDGEMPIELKKLRTSIRECLDELAVYSANKLEYEFINPASGSEKERAAFYTELVNKGLLPMPIQMNDAEGGATQRIIFPSALVAYGGKERAVNFMSYNDELSPDENINIAYQNIEFELVSSIALLARKEFPSIAFIEGHDELDFFETGDIEKELSQYYKVNHVTLNGNVGVLDEYKAVIVAKPQSPWSEDDKLVIDQYIMNGGSVAWFIDQVNVHEDSLANGERTYAVANNHNLNDLLFRYGARVNSDLIQDLQSAYIPVNIAPIGSPPNFQPSPWFYYPLLFASDSSVISKGVNLVKAKYAGTIDFVGGKYSNIRKTVLLHSSSSVLLTKTPAVISLSQVNNKITETNFNQSNKTVAAIFEGSFDSGFKNRIVSEYNSGKAFDFVGEGKPAKMFIASDGDIIRNEVSRRASGTSIFPLGFDRYLNRTFGNKSFVKNVILYLTDDSELLEIRSHNITLRLLDKEMLVLNRTRIILLNALIPIIIVIAFGLLFSFVRKRKYSRKKS